MATTKYLSEFYSFKTYVPTSRTVEDPNTPLEQTIQVLVLQGNQLYASGKYLAALGAYLNAWGKLPKVIHSRFPDLGIIAHPEALLQLDLTEPLIASSVDVHLLRATAGPSAPLAGLADLPPELLKLSKQYGGETVTPADLHYERGLALANPTAIKDAVKDFASHGAASGIDPATGAPLSQSYPTAPVIQAAGQAAGSVAQKIASSLANPVLFAGIGSGLQAVLTYHWDDIKAWLLETFGGQEKKVIV